MGVAQARRAAVPDYSATRPNHAGKTLQVAQVKKVKNGPANTLTALRLYTQGLAGARFRTPEEVVRALGAVQGQDYNAALWALGQRLEGATVSDVEAAFARRTIVRTWPMRGTLHIVPAEDARWMLALMTPRVIAASATRFRQLELDEKVFSKSTKLVEKALQGGKQIARPDFYKVLERGGISTAGSRGLHILGFLAQKQVVCFGPRAGKQQTLVLLDEWLPESRPLPEEEALGLLARKYFTGHGPATVQDLAWWSGLTLSAVKKGLDSVKSEFDQLTIGERVYWLKPGGKAGEVDDACLLPVYDEYLVAYRDRTAALDPARKREPGDGIFSPTVLLDGIVAGTWTRTAKKDRVVVNLSMFAPLRAARQRQVEEATQRFGEFLGLSAEVSG
jgi:hypothetical protein